jgi:hypothetical protein
MEINYDFRIGGLFRDRVPGLQCLDLKEEVFKARDREESWKNAGGVNLKIQ